MNTTTEKQMTRTHVNAKSQHNPDPDYACELIMILRKRGVTTEQVARRAGVHSRSLYRAMEIGFQKFPLQVILECMAGKR